MTITITIPTIPGTGELVRLLTPLAEPCLIAAAGMLGLGPIGQAVFATVLKVARENISF